MSGIYTTTGRPIPGQRRYRTIWKLFGLHEYHFGQMDETQFTGGVNRSRRLSRVVRNASVDGIVPAGETHGVGDTDVATIRDSD